MSFDAIPPGTLARNFALITVDLGSSYQLVPCNRLLNSFYIHPVGHKDSDITSVCGHFAEIGPAKRKGWTCLHTPKTTE